MVVFSGMVLACLFISSSAMPTVATTDAAVAHTTSSSSATPLQLFNEVIMGVKVMERLNVSSLRGDVNSMNPEKNHTWLEVTESVVLILIVLLPGGGKLHTKYVCTYPSNMNR